MFGDGRERRQPILLHRHASDGTYSMNTSLPSKTHRRTSSFNGWLASQGRGSGSDIPAMSSAVPDMDPLPTMLWSSTHMSRIYNGDDPMPQQTHMMMGNTYPSSQYCSTSEQPHHHLDADQDDKCLRILDLIRELSFCSSPSEQLHKTKKRSHTEETVPSSSSSETSDPEDHDEDNYDDDDDDDDTSPFDLIAVQQVQDLRRASPSPLVGLQFLPDGYTYI